MGFDVMQHHPWGQQPPMQQPAPPMLAQPQPGLSTGSAGVSGRAQSFPTPEVPVSVPNQRNSQVGYCS